MQLALAHNNTDFDSLAAQYAVSRLYGDVRMVPGYPLQGNIKQFLSLYRDVLPLVELNYIPIDAVTHLYIVDCQQVERLDEIARNLISKRRCTYTIFDHHAPDETGFLKAARHDSIVKPAGACTTILVEKLMQEKVQLTAFEATLLAIGIYEDSGCLTYGGTTPADATAVAYLLERGADLQQVANFVSTKLNLQQTQLFQTLIKNCRVVTVSGAKILVASAQCEQHIEGLAILTRRLLEVLSGDAAVAVVFMRDRVHVVGRSDARLINVRELARAFGGDGHPGAASAVVKDRPLGRVVEDVTAWLEQAPPEQVTAGAIMRSPVRTIAAETTMEEAARLMLRYDEEGLIVTENGGIVGVVSKRDIDKALHHKLGHAPVKGFMSRPVISARASTTLAEVQEVMVKEDIGRLPVLDEQDELIGIVTRREVLRTLFGGKLDQAAELSVVIEKRRLHLQKELEALDPATRWLFQQVGAVAGSIGMTAYAVGGCVRDLFLGRQNFDLDFVVEGNAIELAAALEKAYPGRFALAAAHERFQTATITYRGPVRREVDLSTARIEFYEHPAALPTVEASLLEQDLFRRDFTVNTLAICLNPDECGDVIDYFDGFADMERRLIRILHKFSFIEDPTRIVRAARFCSRLGFALEPGTRRQAERAIAMGVFDNLGGFRLKEELKLILDSAERLAALDLLNSLGGGLRYLAVDLRFDEQVRSAMRRAQRLLARNPLKDSWVVYLGAMLASLSAPVLESVMERLSLANDERQCIRSGLSLLRHFATTAGQSNPSRSEIYALLHGHNDQALALAASLAAAGSRTRRWIKLYLDELRDVRVNLSGTDLMRIGFPQGPQIGEALQRLREAKLDGAVKTAAQEMQFIRKTYPQYC